MGDTSTTSLPGEVATVIAEKLLMRPDDQYIFAARGPIESVDAEMNKDGVASATFNRPQFQGGLYTEAARRLVETTDIGAGSIALAEDSVTLTTREYGGPHDGAAVLPFGVREFLQKRSKHDVIAWLDKMLVRDYFRFTDRVYMDLLLSTTTVKTPNGAAEGAITAGQTFSVAFLRTLNKVFKDLKIPTYEDGRWRLILNTKDEYDLKSDAEYKAIANPMAGSNPQFMGHVANLEGFQIGTSTHLYTKGVGAGSAVTGYQSVGFGPFGIGHATSMAPQPRQRAENDFGRKNHVLWLSHEAFGLLYSDLIVRTITT